MIEKTFTITNELGIHARPAAQLVKITSNIKSAVYISNNNIEVNAKSIMGVLTLNAGYGSRITLKVDGEDEIEAMGALEELVVHKHFNE